MAKEYSGVKLDVTFTKASTRENIISAENIALSFGKLAKWYTDFAWSAWTAPTVEVTGSGNAITSALYGIGTNANKLTLTKGTTFLTSDTQFIKAITSSGSGGAVTGMSVSSGTLTYTLGNPHPTIPTQTDTTSSASPDHGETFTTVDSVTRDSNGHVTSINVKTVTLPSSVPAHTHNFLDSKYFSDPALLAAEEGNFFFSGVNLIANVNDWVGLQAGYSMDKFQLIGISQRLGFRQNDTGGSNTSGWSDWKTCLYPEDVTGENGITATLVSSTYGSGATAYVYNTGVKLGHTNSVTAVTNYFRPYMKYDAQGHVTASNYWMHTAKGTDNTAGWVQIATIKHTATNDNTPIVLNIAQRGNSVAYRLHMYWNNANSTDPSLGKFILASDHNWEAITPRAYIIKSATSTWDIYVLKLDKYESIAVTMQPGGYFTRCEWTWKDVQTAESAITGGTEATKKVYSTTDHTHAYLPLAGGTMDTNAEITIPNVNNVAKLTYGSMNFKVGISGGWARGFNFFSDDFSTRIGALGVYGSQNATAPDYMYFGKAYNDTWYRFYKTSCLISDADNAGFDFQYKPANLDAGYSGSFIQLKAAEKYGYGIIIGRRHGGMTMIGAGESANGLCNVIENSLNPWASSTFGYDSENLFNISDVSIYFISGANGLSTSAYTDWTDIKTALFDNNGYFRPSKDKNGQIGASNYRWNYGYFGTVDANTANITNSAFGPLTITRSGATTGASIKFVNSNGTLGYIGMKGSADSGLFRWSANTSSTYLICDDLNTSVTQVLTSGTKIATIKIAGTSTDLYCQTNTDANVKQSTSGYTGFRPIVLGYTNSSTVSNLDATVTNQVYVTTKLYTQPSTGKLFSDGGYYVTSSGKGLTLVDSSGTSYYGIFDNGANLWIGAGGTGTVHHNGKTFISTGLDGTAGNSTIWVAVPTGTNNEYNTYSVLHTGNMNSLIPSTKYALVVDESADFASYAWHKFAEVTLSDANADASITFLVSKTWGNVGYSCGILTAHIRTGSTKVYNSGHFRWLVIGGAEIDPAEFVFVYTNTASTSCKVELWHKQTQRYDGWVFKVLKEHSRTTYGANPWTLFRHSGHGSATYTTGTGTIVSALNTIANTAASSDKINTDAGDFQTPVYFSNGVPVAVNIAASGAYFGIVPQVRQSDGVMEIGKYIDFHATNASTNDYDIRLEGSSTSLLKLVSNSGTPQFRIAGTLPRLNFQQTTSGSAYENANCGIAAYPANTSGVNLVIQSSGNMYIGGGESVTAMYTAVKTSGANPYTNLKRSVDSGGTASSITPAIGNEKMFITSDEQIFFAVGANGLSTSAYTDWTNLKTVLLDSDGFFRPSIDNKGQIGTSDYRWKAVHATEVVGNAVGKDGFIAYPEDGTFSGSDQVAPVSCITITLPIDTSVITSDNYFKVGFKVDMWCYSPLLYYTSDTLTIAGLIMTGNPTLAWYSVTALSNCFPFNVSFGFLNSKAQIQIVIPNVVTLYAPEIRIRDIIVIDGFGNHNTFAENKSGWIIESNSGFPAGYEETRFILNSSSTSQPGLMLYGGLIPSKAVIDSTGLLYAGKSVGFYTTNDATTPSYILDSTTENTLSAYAYGNYTIFNIKSKDYARLSFQTTKSGKTYTASGIIMYPLKTSGMTALFSCGGNMVIGGGEFANNAYARKDSSNASQVGYDNIVTTENEKLYLGADSEVQIISNAGSIQAYNNNDHKVWKFQTNGKLLTPNAITDSLDNEHTMIEQNLRSSSNCVSLAQWIVNGAASAATLPGIYYHNTGGDSTDKGAIILQPYHSSNHPWDSGHPIGLYIGKGILTLDGTNVSLEGHTHKYAGSSSAGGAATTVQGTLTNPTSETNYPIPFHATVSTDAKTLRNNDGLIYTTKEGTASALGYSVIRAGNGVASGTAGNKYGVLRIYSTGTNYAQIKSSTLTANRTVTLPDTNCTVGTGFFYVLGTQNKKTRMWTGNLPIPALYDGLTIAFYLPFDVKQETTDINDGNVTNVWIKLTLSNGTTTDWVPAYWTNQSRLTTHFVAGSTVMLTYMSNPQVNGSPAAVPVTGWPSNARWTRADYNTNSDTKVNVTLGTTTKAYLLGTSTTPTSTAAAVTTIADTGVYLDTTAGMITATTFNGAATKLSTDAGTEVDPVYFTNGVPTVCKTPNASVSGYGYSSSKPYYKMAETANITSAKTSYRICFLVSKRKIADSTTNASYGIMCVHFESSTSNGTFGYGSVKWLAVENGLDTSSISVKYTTGTNKFSVAIWAKLSSTDDLIIMRSIDNHGFSYESNTAVWSFISNATAAASASGTEIPVTISLLQNTIGGGQSLLYNGSVNLGSTSTSSPAQLTISGNYPLADYQALLIEFWSPGSGNSNRIVVPLRYVRSQTAGTIVWFQLLPTAQSSDATSTNHNNCIGISSNSGGSSYTKKVLVVSGGNITGTWLIRVYSLS